MILRCVSCLSVADEKFNASLIYFFFVDNMFFCLWACMIFLFIVKMVEEFYKTCLSVLLLFFCFFLFLLLYTETLWAYSRFNMFFGSGKLNSIVSLIIDIASKLIVSVFETPTIWTICLMFLFLFLYNNCLYFFFSVLLYFL